MWSVDKDEQTRPKKLPLELYLGNVPSIGQENRMASGGPEIAGTLSLIFCFFVNASACRDIEDVYNLEFFQTFLPRWEKQVPPQSV